MSTDSPNTEGDKEKLSARQRTNSFDGATGPTRTQSVSTRKRKGGSVRIPKEKDNLAVDDAGTVGTHTLQREHSRSSKDKSGGSLKTPRSSRRDGSPRFDSNATPRSPRNEPEAPSLASQPSAANAETKTAEEQQPQKPVDLKVSEAPNSICVSAEQMVIELGELLEEKEEKLKKFKERVKALDKQLLGDEAKKSDSAPNSPSEKSTSKRAAERRDSALLLQMKMEADLKEENEKKMKELSANAGRRPPASKKLDSSSTLISSLKHAKMQAESNPSGLPLNAELKKLSHVKGSSSASVGKINALKSSDTSGLEELKKGASTKKVKGNIKSPKTSSTASLADQANPDALHSQRALKTGDLSDRSTTASSSTAATQPMHGHVGITPSHVGSHFNLMMPLSISEKDNATQQETLLLEVLTSEQLFITNLELLISTYISHLKEKEKEKKDKEKDGVITALFGYIDDLLQINTSFLCQLTERLIHWEECGQDHISDIFQDYIARVRKTLSLYCDSLWHSKTTLLARIEGNSSLKKFVEMTDSQYHVKFSNLISSPLERIRQYDEIVDKLYANTPVNHRDFSDLKKVSIILKQLLEDADQRVRASESNARMKSITARGGGFERLIATETEERRQRSWFKDGEIAVIAEIERSGKDHVKLVGRKKKVEMILLTDSLIASCWLNKRSDFRSFSQPTNIVWITDSFKHPLAAPLRAVLDQDFIFWLLLFGPEKEWILGFNDEQDKLRWADAICRNIGSRIPPKNIQEAATGHRKGKYIFSNDRTEYDGGWLDGTFDGSGEMVHDGQNYNGYWNAALGVGIGIHQETKQIYGWKFVKDSITELAEPSWISQSFSAEKDWELIFNSNRVKKTIPANTCLLEEGKHSQVIYRVRSGKLRLEKAGKSLATIVANEKDTIVIGDTYNYVFASTYASSDCNVESVQLSKLTATFMENPALCMRFYKHVAKKLGNSLKQLHTQKKTESDHVDEAQRGLVRNASAKHASIVQPTYHDRFGLSPTEVGAFALMADCVQVKKKYKRIGKVYLYQNYLCFEHNIMGKKEIDNHLLSTIAIESKKGKINIKKDGNKYCCYKDIKNPNFEVLLLEYSHKQSGKATNPTVTLSDHSDSKKSAKSTKKLKSKEGSSVIKKAASEATSIEMTAEDWESLAAFSEIIKARDGEALLTEGVETKVCIYTVGSGKVKITKNNADGVPQVIGQMSEGDVFGDLSFLDATSLLAVPSASIIADGEVAITKLEGEKILQLFVANPPFAGRFYSYLADIIAGRLQEREKTSEAEKEADLQSTGSVKRTRTHNKDKK